MANKKNNNKKRTRWPKEMPNLKPRDFVTNAWCLTKDDDDVIVLREDDGSDPLTIQVDEIDPREIHCGSKACVIGHVRHAFGLPADPEFGGPTPSQGLKFARKFMEIWTGQPWSYRGLMEEVEIARVFDGERFMPQITPRAAARVWGKTLEHFDYTEDA